ncbi:hypothetical protein PoB_004339000 [Plakobranchus ocellatus]|uniref:VCBS repeat-containing protein n=1 Tax=Plakobranchus ocellatus TaxID=259542 RepID=A0AAV4B8I2_9GAST|nr:hypothetical protein PoB_004339000 [Plakobranchus ocellatus]
MKSSPLSLRFTALMMLSAVFVIAASLPYNAQPRLIGKFPFQTSAFCSLFPNTSSVSSGARGGAVKYDLLLSAFGFFETNVGVVVDIGAQLKNISAIQPRSITKKMKWPNAISGVPKEVLNTETPYIAIPDGFLVPGKGEGSVTLEPLLGGQSYAISDGKDWFYHRVQWVDMDKDGDLDIVTCKAQKPILESSKGQLVWYANPDDHSLTRPWTEHVLAAGPDVLFRMTNLSIAGEQKQKEIIVTAEYFNPRLRIFWSDSPKEDWSNPGMIKFRDIDKISAEEGAPFDVILADVNGDENLDIVLTLSSNKNGSVVVYEFPSDFRSGVFKRHVIASGYKPVEGGPNSGAPGLLSLLPAKERNQKPSIVVAGDDSGLVSLLEPIKPSSTDWTYKRTDILDVQKSRTGGICVGDVDGDGRQEIFASSYNEGLVYVYQV